MVISLPGTIPSVTCFLLFLYWNIASQKHACRKNPIKKADYSVLRRATQNGDKAQLGC
jgi:hypothetical protein